MVLRQRAAPPQQPSAHPCSVSACQWSAASSLSEACLQRLPQRGLLRALGLGAAAEEEGGGAGATLENTQSCLELKLLEEGKLIELLWGDPVLAVGQLGLEHTIGPGRDVPSAVLNTRWPLHSLQGFSTPKAMQSDRLSTKLDSPQGTSCSLAMNSSFKSMVEQNCLSLSLMAQISWHCCCTHTTTQTERY